MADTSNIKSGMTVTFKLATKLIKDVYTNVTVKGIVSFDIASAWDDVASQHANIFSTLPVGTPENPEDYEYLLVRTVDGETLAVGVPWISGDITVVTSATLRIPVNNASVADVEKVRTALNGYGYTDLTVEVLSTSAS